MKKMRARAAAVLCAAITTVCGAQALSASAYSYTVNTQSYCENPMNMSHNVYLWSVYNYEEGERFTAKPKSGLVLGYGFSSNPTSGYYSGKTLTGSEAFARTLAEQHFGTTTFMEYGGGKNLSVRIGDQIHMFSGNSKKTVFLTSIGNYNYCAEVDDATKQIHWGTRYILHNGAFIQVDDNGSIIKSYTVDYVLRPIKRGDANGDSFVNAADVSYIANNFGKYANSFPGKRYDVMMAALDMNGNWQIDRTDADTVRLHYSNGILGDYGYVRM